MSIRAGRLLMAMILAAWLVLASMVTGSAASPDVSPAPAATAGPQPTAGIIGSGDPRSNGQGPGLVGSPFAILAGVILLGLITAGGTLLYLRVTRDE
jgi:hypothetical protein